MIRLRTGTVQGLRTPRPGVLELDVEVEGRGERALAYPELTGPVREGDRVQLNTTAVSLGLGTGGWHVVVAVDGQADLDPEDAGHVMKLRYTPLQAKVLSVEEEAGPDRERLLAAERRGLEGLPVVWAPLHSMLGGVCAGARAAGAGRVVYVMTDGAALPAWVSGLVADLRAAGLLDAVVTTGQALGGDYEAVNLFTGLLAAREVAAADVAVVADGPGKVGTGTKWGASDVAAGLALHVVSILGGVPIAVPRINFARPEYRHHGISPHTVTVLTEVAPEARAIPVHLPIPSLEGEERDVIWSEVRRLALEERCQVVEVDGRPAIDALRRAGIEGETMGSGFDDDPAFFLAAGAAGILSGRLAASASGWRVQGEAR